MTTEKLKHLYNQVAVNPNCIACLLMVYAKRNRLEDMEMANLLQVDLDRFYQLGILFVPTSLREVKEVADAHGVDAVKLSKLLRAAREIL